MGPTGIKREKSKKPKFPFFAGWLYSDLCVRDVHKWDRERSIRGHWVDQRQTATHRLHLPADGDGVQSDRTEPPLHPRHAGRHHRGTYPFLVTEHSCLQVAPTFPWPSVVPDQTGDKDQSKDSDRAEVLGGGRGNGARFTPSCCSNIKRILCVLLQQPWIIFIAGC